METDCSMGGASYSARSSGPRGSEWKTSDPVDPQDPKPEPDQPAQDPSGAKPKPDQDPEQQLREARMGQEAVIHSSRFVLVDSEARIRGYYDSRDPGALLRLRTDLRRVDSAPTG